MDKVRSATLEVFLNWRVETEGVLVIVLVVPSGALLVRGALCDDAPALLAAVLAIAWLVCIRFRVECEGDTGSDCVSDPQAASPMDPDPMAALFPLMFMFMFAFLSR
jgi:hypothetical protein